MQEKFVLRAIKKLAAIGAGAAMLGATMTSALAADLADFPSPFVIDGKYDDSTVFVYGDNALAADTAAIGYLTQLMQLESKEVVVGDNTTTSVIGGVTEDIPIGGNLTASGYIDPVLEHSEIASLFDDEISFQGKDYDTSEALYIASNNGPAIVSSIVSNDDDMKENVYLEFPSEDTIRYVYRFDETIALNKTSSSDPLIIDFLGKQLKITSIDSDTKFTASIGDEYYLTAGESVQVEGKTVTLENVGSSSAVVSVDGTVKTINAGSALTVNGLEVYVDSVVSRTALSESTATLVIGLDARDTYQSGDKYPGEDENNPNWVWKLVGLDVEGVSDSIGNSTLVLAVRNRFTATDTDDSMETGVGECVDLPNKYLSICVDSLTVPDDDYMDLNIEYKDSVNVHEVGYGQTNVPALHLWTSVNEGLKLTVVSNPDGIWNPVNGTSINGTYTSDIKTDNIWLDGNGTAGTYNVVYENSNNQKRLAGIINGSLGVDRWAEINYGNTQDENVYFSLGAVGGDVNAPQNLSIKINGKTSTDLPAGKDDIITSWRMSSGEFAGLGSTDSNEAGELYVITGGVGGSLSLTDFSTKDENHRTRYGIIIKDPKSNSASQRVALKIPNEQVFAKVIIKGEETKYSKGTTTYTAVPISPSIKKASAVEDELDEHQLIFVGGPCANPLVETVFEGVTCAGWAYEAGEAIVLIKDEGEKVALLIAGTDGEDTEMAAKALVNYDEFAFAGESVVVKGKAGIATSVETATTK